MEPGLLRISLLAIFVTFGSNFPQVYPTISINPSINVYKNYLNACYTERYGSPIDTTNYNILWPIIVCSSFLGTLIGTPFVPILANRLGRVFTMCFGSSLFIIAGCILQLLAIRFRLYELLAVGRMVGGISAGIGMAIQSIYLIECAPVQWRGRIGSVMQAMISWESVISALLGLEWLFGQDHLIYFLVGAPIVPALILLGSTCFLPESPHFVLLRKQDKEGALKTVEQMLGKKADKEKIISAIEDEEKSKTDEDNNTPNWRLLIGKYRLNLAIGVVAFCSVQLSGIGGLSRFSTDWFVRSGITESIAQICTLGVFVVFAISPTLASPLTDKLGRRPMLLGSMVACWLCSALFVIFSEIHEYLEVEWAGYCVVASIVAFAVVFGLGQGTVGYFLVSEVMPYAHRATADMIATFCMNAVTLITNAVVFPLTDSINQFSYAILYLLPYSVCIVFLWWKMPETRGRELAEVANELAKEE